MNPTDTTTAHRTGTDELVAAVVGEASGVLVAGRTRPGRGRLPVRNPADGAVWAEVSTGGPDDAEAAVRAASGALESSPGVAARAAALRAVADDLEQAGSSDAWARLISRETGKRLAEAKGELVFSATYFRVFADLAEADADGPTFDVVPGIHHVVQAGPVGVVAVLTPWNFPISIPARKIAAAVAAGCPVVFKPSELAPLSSMVLSRLLDRHLPEGMVNTVLGEPGDVVAPWLADPAVQALSFTGSTRVGRILAVDTAPRFLRSVMELGGCAPFIVLPDADPQAAAAALMVAKYRNNGQSCIAANQVFVADSVADAFTEAFVAASDALAVGDPTDPGTGLGPVAPAGDPARLRALVDDALGAGARLASTHRDLPGAGHYVAPAVLLDVPASVDAFRAEIFGPVTAVRRFQHVDEAVQTHLGTGYGLAGYVCGSDLDAARAVAGRLRAGIVGINTGTPNYPGAPFGGQGLSGLGYEGGRQGLDAFRAFRTVAVSAG